ncbi:hypothetical protein QL285_093610 [Trifolium repens]|nr:hypothetical protein QL285_093610 [Trifolium repens]
MKNIKNQKEKPEKLGGGRNTQIRQPRKISNGNNEKKAITEQEPKEKQNHRIVANPNRRAAGRRRADRRWCEGLTPFITPPHMVLHLDNGFG